MAANNVSIAYFISPHGYGHAARASAVMTALQTLRPNLHFEIFTRTPSWFFADSGVQSYRYHELLTDIGLVQKDALSEDMPQTIATLDEFLPFDPAFLHDLARQVTTAKPPCRLVLCDIAPMGIAVAHEAGIPSVLIENFTWDWIYEGYPDYSAQLEPHIAYLRHLFESADYHIQTEPLCEPRPADLLTPPISRKIREPRSRVRQKLAVPDAAKMVTISMGGVSWDYGFLEQSSQLEQVVFVAAGSNQQRLNSRNLINLSRELDIFHPDLVNASDAVLGKVGYSTIAEIYQAGAPFGFLTRPAFRESPVLERYASAHLPSLTFTEGEFQNGEWLAKVAKLLALPRNGRPKPNGADQIARFLLGLL